MNKQWIKFATPKEIQKRLTKENFYWRVGYYALLIAAFTHGMFILLFSMLQLPVLALFNIGSVGLYLFCIFAIGIPTVDRKDDRLIGWLVYFELIAHNVLASYFLSKEAGFSYYIYFLAILPFFVLSYSRIMYLFRVLSVLIVVGFIELSVWFENPKIPLDNGIIDWLHIFNLFVFIIVLSLISYLYATQASAYHLDLIDQNTKDPLSRLYNRRYVQQYFEEQTQTENIGILLVDIDFFKTINDTHGHVCGDKVIRHVSDTLKECLKGKNAVVARWGGEEFIVIFQNTTKQELFFDAEYIRESVESLIVRCSDMVISITVTIGGVYSRGEPYDALLLRADEALYLGKANGRNQVHIKE